MITGVGYLPANPGYLRGTCRRVVSGALLALAAWAR
jgi:hypothetical protein